MGSHEGAIKDATDYMNQWVAPHRLVSVSAFEEDHPNSLSKLFNVVVLQRGNGEKPNSALTQETVIGGIYNWQVIIEENGWNNLLSRASVAAEKRDRSLISGFNWSTHGGDDQAAAIVTWSKIHEDMLMDGERGGCSCLIF